MMDGILECGVRSGVSGHILSEWLLHRGVKCAYNSCANACVHVGRMKFARLRSFSGREAVCA